MQTPVSKLGNLLLDDGGHLDEIVGPAADEFLLGNRDDSSTTTATFPFKSCPEHTGLGSRQALGFMDVLVNGDARRSSFLYALTIGPDGEHFEVLLGRGEMTMGGGGALTPTSRFLEGPICTPCSSCTFAAAIGSGSANPCSQFGKMHFASEPE